MRVQYLIPAATLVEYRPYHKVEIQPRQKYTSKALTLSQEQCLDGAAKRFVYEGYELTVIERHKVEVIDITISYGPSS